MMSHAPFGTPHVRAPFLAGCPGTLNCGCPARVPGAAAVVSFIGLGVVSAGRAGGGEFGLLLEAQPKMMRVMKYRVVRTY